MQENTRYLFSILFCAVGIILAVSAGIIGYTEEHPQGRGTVIDFGDYDTQWIEAEIGNFTTTEEVLRYACEQKGYELEMDESGSIESIDGISVGGTWCLFGVYSGQNHWTILDSPYNQDPNEFSITSWYFSQNGEEPTVAVDYSGQPIYGYTTKYRVVSLSPSITEMLCSVKASRIIVGTDMYSNYPEFIAEQQNEGKISIVGTYTSPSFELITDTNPDIVICDGLQTGQVQMADRLRAVGIDAVVTFPSEEFASVMDNLFIIGQSINYNIAAIETIDSIETVMNELTVDVNPQITGEPISVMLALDTDASPFISGKSTYIDSIATQMNSENVFSNWIGWVHITADRIPYENPQAIIIVTYDYKATQEEYDYLYENLAPQWKLTDAWKNGNIFVICEDAAEMASRCGPRVAQVAEIVAEFLHPEVFDFEVPKIIGSNYKDYLHLSKGVGL